MEATLNQVQFKPKCRSILISMWIAKIRTPRLARFSLYNLPAWLKTRSDGADLAVIHRSSRAAAFRSGKWCSLFKYPKTGISKHFCLRATLAFFIRTGQSYVMRLFRDVTFYHINKSSGCYILPNQQVSGTLHFTKSTRQCDVIIITDKVT